VNVPTISAAQAKQFGSVWKHNGIHIFMDDPHHQFAADFANIVLRSFVEEANRQAAEAAKPKVVIAEG
jgi:hypothetical protein